MLLASVTATAGATSLNQARGQFEQHMTTCASLHHYDPGASDALGAYELGPEELGWRACVYEGIHRFLIPVSAISEDYLELIESDRRMTDGIVAGDKTREQRRERIDRLITAIDEREEALHEALLAELEATREKLYALQRRLDRMNTIQQMQGAAFSATIGKLK